MRKSKYIILMLCTLMFSACDNRIGFGEPVTGRDMSVLITPDFRQMEKPSNLKAVFFTMNGTFFGSYDLPPEGGKVTLEEGEYKVILYNDDAESIVFNLAEHATATAQIASTKSLTQELPSPGTLYTATGTVSTQSLLLTPPFSVRSTNIILKIEIKGEQDMGIVSVSLRNIADAVNLSTGMAHHSSDKAVNLTLFTDRGEHDGYNIFTGTVFGCCQHESCPMLDRVFVDITLEMPSGEQKTLVADITEAISEAQQAVTEVSVDIRIERVIDGLNATVIDWTTGTAGGNIIRD